METRPQREPTTVKYLHFASPQPITLSYVLALSSNNLLGFQKLPLFKRDLDNNFHE
jgi:hypothetical protein